MRISRFSASQGLLVTALLFCAASRQLLPADEPGSGDRELADRCLRAMKVATEYLTAHVAVQGGYVYEVTLDLKYRRGEGTATPTEIWVQPPGTPAVGSAFLQAWKSTGDPQFLDAAVDCARALMHGQLESGGWSDRVDFDPQGKNTGRYRNGKGKGKGKNYSTLDDDKTQSALRLMIEVDQALAFRNSEIHEATEFALASLLKAQFANGGFPQGWEQPVEPGVVVKASFPEYDWRTEGRFKNYWDFETLNDGLAGTVTQTLQLAFETYGDQRFRDALLRFGDFLIRAQLPEPQPAWAQQYNHSLQPIWARKFEPPAVAGRESEDVIATLLYLTEVTGERRFLEPIPAAIAWLKRSRLSDGQIARFYELQTNTPLYLTKDTYELTYDDSNLPTHYGFKSRSKVESLEARFHELNTGAAAKKKPASIKSLRGRAVKVLEALDAEGRWVTDKKGDVVSNPKDRKPQELLLKSQVFCENLNRLAEFVAAAKSEQ